MHRKLVTQMLQEEVAQVRAGFLLRRLTSIELVGTTIEVVADAQGTTQLFAFDGSNYDAQPLSLVLLDPGTGQMRPVSEWPAGLNVGDHPALGRPFSCTRGLFEYHCHSSHIEDPWEHHRYSLRFPTILGQILNKAGVLEQVAA